MCLDYEKTLKDAVCERKENVKKFSKHGSSRVAEIHPMFSLTLQTALFVILSILFLNKKQSKFPDYHHLCFEVKICWTSRMSLK